MSYLLIFPIIACCFFFVSSIIGSILFQGLLKGEKNESVFITLLSPFIGTLVLVSLISLLTTGFVTINIFIVAILAILFKTNYRNWELKFERQSIKLMFVNSVTFLIVFFSTLIVSVHYDYTEILNLDFLFYSSVVINGIETTGVENAYGYFNNYMSGDVMKTAPYHYFEFWLVIFFNKIITGYTSIIVLKYLVYVFFKTYIVLAFYNLIKCFKPNLSVFFLVVIFLTTLIPIDLFFAYFTNGWDIHASFWERPNFLTYVFVIVSSIPFLLNRQFFYFSIFILLLPIISITTAPVIFISNFIFLIILFWRKKIIKKEFIIALTTTVLLAVLILSFYYLTGEKQISALESDKTIIEHYFMAWKAMVYYIVTLMLISITPLLFVGVLSFKFEKYFPYLDLIIYSMITISSGIIFFQLLYFMDNSYQFTYVGYTFLYVVVISIVLIGMLLRNKLKYLFYIFPVFGLFSLVFGIKSISSFDIRLQSFFNIEKTLLTNESLTKLQKGGKVIVIMGEDEVKEILPKKRHLLTNLPFSSLSYLADYEIIPVVDSNVLYFPIDDYPEETFKKAHDFNDRLPNKWKTLDYIDEIAITEKVKIIVLPKEGNVLRRKINLTIVDSMEIGGRKLLFLY